jgi:non-ribosomal peptide synthetase component E (peptide arylation enzyme)
MMIVERILEGAERTPTRPAIIAEGRPMSYRQLAALAHVAARRMHDAGVRPGEIVEPVTAG